MTTAEEYEAACLIERLAIGDDGAQREQSRQIVLSRNSTAQEAARYARIAVCDQVVALDRAIKTLGLDA